MNFWSVTLPTSISSIFSTPDVPFNYARYHIAPALPHGIANASTPYSSLQQLMFSHSPGPDAVRSSRRRASTSNSPGLDYSSCYRVEDDILSRIRSLLLSRNIHRPPRTPYSSDEQPRRYSGDCDNSNNCETVDRFDFRTAKSVANQAHLRHGRLSCPESIRIRSNSDPFSMDAALRPTDPTLSIPKPATFRDTSSTNDVNALIDDATVHATLLTCCPPCPPEALKNPFRLPPPAMRDETKMESRDRIIRSREEAGPTEPSLAESSIHKTNPPCCPPSVQPDTTLSRYAYRRSLSGVKVKAEPADFECFLAGCSPGPGECKKHRRRASQQRLSLKQRDRLLTDIKAVGQDIADDVLKLGLTISEVKFRSPLLISGINAQPSTIDASQLELQRKEPSHVDLVPSLVSPTSSVFSLDTFPHAVQSQETAAKAGLANSLSATVVTNFSLPGQKAKRAKPSALTDQADSSVPKSADSIRAKQSEASLKCKPCSPSILSGGSKASSVRHALLKPSVSATEPVDTGLPTPPILTQVVASSWERVAADGIDPEIAGSAPDKATVTDPRKEISGDPLRVNFHANTHAAPATSHLTDPQKAKGLVDRIKERVSESKDWLRDEFEHDEGTTTIIQHFNSPIGAVETSGKPLLKSIASVKNLLDSPKPVEESPATLSQVDSVNASYWGFSPAVQEAVQDAVHVAVQKAVDEIVVPPGIGHDEASRAYRRLVGDSLVEAAKDADEYLRRASLWDRASEGTLDLRGQTLHGADQFTAGSSHSCRSSPHTNHKHSRLRSLSIPTQQENNGQCNVDPVVPSPRKLSENRDIERSDAAYAAPIGNVPDSSENPTPHEYMTTVPHEFVEEKVTEKPKNAWKIPGTWNGRGKRDPLEYTAIPTRRSSRNHVLSSNDRATRNSSAKETRKGKNSGKGSLEQVKSRSTRGLRSVSSLGSIKSFVQAGRDQADGQESTTQVLLDASIKQYSVKQQASEEKLGRKNTVHWLRELLSSNGPYETRLTALPPRTRRDENSSTGRLRSQTAPAKPVTEIFLGATIKPEEPYFGIPNAENADKQAATVSQTFTKTINDLEFLLNEALFIARQAADREDAAYAPALLESATAVLKHGRKGFEDQGLRLRSEEVRGGSLAYQKILDDASSIASIHESLRSYSESSASESSQEGNEAESYHHTQPDLRTKEITVGIAVPAGLAQSSHHAGWPPTGRVPTPYPPASIPPSPPEEAIEKNDLIFALEKGDIKDVNPFLSNVRTSAISSEALSPMKRSRATTGRKSQPSNSNYIDDRAIVQDACKPLPRPLPMPPITPRGVSITKGSQKLPTEVNAKLAKARFPTDSVPSKREVREYIKNFHHPPIYARESSLSLRKQAEKEQAQSKGAISPPTGHTYSWQNSDANGVEHCSQGEVGGRPPAGPDFEYDRATSYAQSFDGSHPSDAIHFDAGYGHRQHNGATATTSRPRELVELRDNPDPNLPHVSKRTGKGSHHLFSLSGKNHISLRGEHHAGFSFARTHKKPKIARDWGPARKRFVATVACISTALVGLLVGVYAAEVPAIQYYIVDFHHYTILGNVFFFIGLAIPTFFCWPLPLLHGRKPYILGSMSLAMPLLFPQALAVGTFRSPYVSTWRVGLILPRAMMGFVLGFANMNFKSTLTDLFGASLQSENPHQEVVDENDVRRHGGGLGVWLGIWTWCTIGSIGMGFLIGAIIINHAPPAWGFYISIVIIAGVLFLNVICPEVRRSAFRRSVAEVKNDAGVSRRVARGEVKMHLVQTGPKWWGEEFHYGVTLNAKMLRQPGFLVLAFYVAWIYGQIVLLIVLIGSLTSKYYKFKSPYVGASVTAVPIGAFLSIPFQKASLFSRSRGRAETTDDNANTLDKKVAWSSHLVRRAIFILVLPFAGLGYTVSSNGPPIPFMVPLVFAGLIGFLSNLAMGECHGIIMETFDTSDLQPGMTGRPRGASGGKTASKRTNYSSFPRVTSGFAITQGIGYLFAALATGVGGVAERNIGQQSATGVMAGILLVLSLLLLGVLARFKEVQIIPNSKQAEMERWKNARRTSAMRRAEGLVEPEEEWRPVIIGNPTHTTRRMCILELGSMTRWSEIRRKNHLVDQNTLEAKHPNLAVMKDVEHRIKEKEREIIHHVRHSLSRGSSRRSKQSDQDDGQPGDLGGHREMLSPSGKGSRRRERGKSRIAE